MVGWWWGGGGLMVIDGGGWWWWWWWWVGGGFIGAIRTTRHIDTSRQLQFQAHPEFDQPCHIKH